GIEKAARFISAKFEKAGLLKWQKSDNYRQQFDMAGAQPDDISIKWNGHTLSVENVTEMSTEKKISWDTQSKVKVDSITNQAEFREKLSNYMQPTEDALVWVHADLEKEFSSLKHFLSDQMNFASAPSVVFVLAKKFPEEFHIDISNQLTTKQAANIVGYLPGESRPEEYVIFSAHYDHLGIDSTRSGDKIFNGANDDASGTTAVMELAKYFAQKNTNQRSLIFVAFTGEEMGGYGSHYFSEQLEPDKVVAMFNLEVIGTTSTWGRNSAYITGFEKSSLGSILHNNLQDTHFQYHPDPYPKQNLFYRSDNATLARLRVPAHTISTSEVDSEPHYHKVSDEASTLDLANITNIIQSIALSTESIISGSDTPTRVEIRELK